MDANAPPDLARLFATPPLRQPQILITVMPPRIERQIGGEGETHLTLAQKDPEAYAK